MNLHQERLDGVSPIIRGAVLRLCDLSETKLKRPLLIVHGWRSVSQQVALYQRGRAMNRETGEWEIVDAGAVVTKAKPGTSAHTVITQREGQPAALGVDVIPITPSGQPDWEVGDAFWDDLYDLAWTCGLDPLGDTIGASLKGDKGHFEEPGWRLKLAGCGLVLPVSEVQPGDEAKGRI